MNAGLSPPDRAWWRTVGGWALRETAPNAPDVLRVSVGPHDRALAGHLNALAATTEGVGRVLDGLAEPTPGRVAVAAAVTALAGAGDRLLERLDDLSADLDGPLAAGWAWAAWGDIAPLAERCLRASNPRHRHLALRCLAVHRRDPGAPLDEALNDAEPALRDAALGLAVRLGQTGRLPALLDRLENAASRRDRLALAEALTRLGEREAGPSLLLVYAEAPFSSDVERYLELALRRLLPVMDADWPDFWVDGLDDPLSRAIGHTVLARPADLGHLAEALDDDGTAALAARGIRRLTGLRLGVAHDGWPDPSDDALWADILRGVPAGPGAAPEPSPEDRRHLRQAALSLAGGVDASTRLLAGRPCTPETCRAVLGSGSNDAVAAARHELACRDPADPDCFTLTHSGD